MAPEKLIAFVLMTTFMSFLPGPSVLFVTAQGAWRGARAGLMAVAGVQTAVFSYFTLTALGLTSLVTTSVAAFLVLKWLGVAYLVYLGATALIGSFQTHPENLSVLDSPPAAKGRSYRDGAIVGFGNPKAILYFVALLPQFIDTTQPMGPQVLVLGAVAMSIDIVAQSAYALAGSALSRAVSRPSVRKWVDRGVGGAFLSLAGLAALYRRAV